MFKRKYKKLFEEEKKNILHRLKKRKNYWKQLIKYGIKRIFVLKIK